MHIGLSSILRVNYEHRAHTYLVERLNAHLGLPTWVNRPNHTAKSIRWLSCVMHEPSANPPLLPVCGTIWNSLSSHGTPHSQLGLREVCPAGGVKRLIPNFLQRSPPHKLFPVCSVSCFYVSWPTSSTVQDLLLNVSIWGSCHAHCGIWDLCWWCTKLDWGRKSAPVGFGSH